MHQITTHLPHTLSHNNNKKYLIGRGTWRKPIKLLEERKHPWTHFFNFAYLIFDRSDGHAILEVLFIIFLNTKIKINRKEKEMEIKLPWSQLLNMKARPQLVL